MTRSPVDLKIVGDRLRNVRICVGQLEQLPAEDLATFSGDFRNPASAESLLRRAIESLLDTARHLLSKAYGLGALEYREVARLAVEKNLVRDAGLQGKFVEIAGFRNRLTHYYDEVTPKELLEILQNELADLDAVARELSEAASRLATNQSS